MIDKNVPTCRFELLEYAPDAFFMGNSGGEIIYVNRQALLLTGYSEQEILGSKMQDFFTSDMLEQQPLRMDLLRQGELVKTERMLRQKNGSLVPVEMHSGMMPGGLLQTFMRDISSRKQKEQALRDSEKRYRELFEKSDDAILIIEDNHFVDCNDATIRMLRYKNKEELLDSHPSDLSPDRQPDGSSSYVKANEMMRIAFERGSHRFEWDHKRADGEVFPVEVLLTAVSKQGKTRILHTVWRDISERKQAQEKLLQAQKMESIGNLAGGVAHDFNNMLSGILGYASILKNKENDPRKLKAIEGIITAAKRSAELTRKLLAFARKGKHLVQAVNLNHVTAEVLELLGRSLDKSIHLKTSLSADLFTIDADPSQIHQVIMNLCVNGAQAMAKGGTVTVKTRNLMIEGIENVQLEVTDTGDGMDEVTVNRAFEPFFTTKKDGDIKGTGLGLATVYGIVKNHGGTIDIQSKPGKGTVITIHFPRGKRKEAPVKETPPLSVPGRGRILVVEDEVVVGDMSRDMLEDLGYSVITAPDGWEGVCIFRERKDEIDGVLLDMKMPRLDGKKTFEKLKKIDPAVRVLITTGYGLNEEVQGLLDAGAVGLIAKPYKMQDLSCAMKKIFQ